MRFDLDRIGPGPVAAALAGVFILVAILSSRGQRPPRTIDRCTPVTREIWRCDVPDGVCYLYDANGISCLPRAEVAR